MSPSKSSAWRMMLEELVKGTNGRVLSQNAREFSGVGTDTRADLKGKIFFALKGDNFDAHDFLKNAVTSGAAALVVHKTSPEIMSLSDQVTVVEVGDTLKAIQDLALFWRQKFKGKVLGITGTNGKTTSKEFTAAILGSKFSVQYSKGSFNNHWGVPISLLSVPMSANAAVIEMGMNHPGELTELSRMVEADAVVCTMVGRGHLEGVGSIEGAAKAKSEIYEHAPDKAVRIFNLENEHTRKMYEKFGRNLPREKVLTFASPETKTDVEPDVVFEILEAQEESIRIKGQIRDVKGESVVPVFGRHNVTNLMTAACFGLVCGMTPGEIWRALPLCRGTWGRNQWVNLECGARVLFDAYNANPESMKAAITGFAGLKPPVGGRKFAILGEMRELGSHAGALHRELGAAAAAAGFDLVWFIGPSHADFAAGLSAGGFQKSSILSEAYELGLAHASLPVLDENDLILIKGSRGVQLEKALAELKPIGFQTKK